MSGLWDRIIPGGENSDRIPAHLVKAAIYLGVAGVFTDAQIAAGLNARLTVPLNAAALSDLAAIRTSITNAANLGAKIDILERFDALNIVVEMGLLTNEATYRSRLGI